MIARKTESRLPGQTAGADLQRLASELGQAHVHGNYVLVSYLTSPVAQGTDIDYVVFATHNAPADKYLWRFLNTSTNVTVEDETDEGIFQFCAEERGELRVSVEVCSGGNPQANLQLTQIIDALDPRLEILLEGEGLRERLNIDKNIGALGGNASTSRELMNDFRGYLFEATNGTDIPPRFLAAILYLEILRNPKSWFLEFLPIIGERSRSKEIALAAEDLNGGFLSSLRTQIDNSLGVSQIYPQIIAMVRQRQGQIQTYTNWRELPSSNNQRQRVNDDILGDFEGLSEEVKIDLFNLLRFPKSNIKLCCDLIAKLKNRELNGIPHRYRDLTQEQFLHNDLALKVIATEFKDGATEAPSPLPPETLGPHQVNELKPNKYSRKVTEIMNSPFISLLFEEDVGSGAMAYGNYDLQSGDNDNQRLWEGQVRNAPIDNVPAQGDPGFVEQLQQDLRELGFLIVGIPNGDFARQTEWAVREFQIYAKMEYIAKEDTSGAPNYLDRLSRFRNVFRYTGPISGVVNAATRSAIQYWKAQRWRCPVIIGAYNSAGTNVFNQNIWLHDEVQNSTRRMFARDFSRYYTWSREPSKVNDQLIVLGQFAQEATATNPRVGPVSMRLGLANHLWDEAEILPHDFVNIFEDMNLNFNQGLQNLVNQELQILNNPTPEHQDEFNRILSTYKVIRAVSEVECIGFFDSITAYDRGFISIGPCHWTLGLAHRNPAQGAPVDNGELCGYLSYLNYIDSQSFRRAIENFGVRIVDSWNRIDTNTGKEVGDGRNLFDDNQRKYASRVALQQDNGNYQPLTTNENEWNYFKSWHWFYRFQMAGRTIDGFKRRMWDMARIRIRDIRKAAFPAAAGVPNVPDPKPGQPNNTRTATIGDVFTSEKAICMILQWHVYLPEGSDFGVLDNGDAGSRIIGAFTNANIPAAAGDSTNWTTIHERSLITSLYNEVNNVTNAAFRKELRRRLDLVIGWPQYAGRTGKNYALTNNSIPRLNDTRDSFQFDERIYHLNHIN